MDAFVGEAGQFGDPTMLRPECCGPQPQQAPPFARRRCRDQDRPYEEKAVRNGEEYQQSKKTGACDAGEHQADRDRAFRAIWI